MLQFLIKIAVLYDSLVSDGSWLIAVISAILPAGLFSGFISLIKIYVSRDILIPGSCWICHVGSPILTEGDIADENNNTLAVYFSGMYNL